MKRWEKAGETLRLVSDEGVLGRVCATGDGGYCCCWPAGAPIAPNTTMGLDAAVDTVERFVRGIPLDEAMKVRFPMGEG